MTTKPKTSGEIQLAVAGIRATEDKPDTFDEDAPYHNTFDEPDMKTKPRKVKARICYSDTSADIDYVEDMKPKPTEEKLELCKHELPLFQSCDKCGREMVEDAMKPDTGTEWEIEQAIEYSSNDDGSIDKEIMRNNIRLLLSNQAKRYEAIIRAKSIQAQVLADKIDKLKQQHREELESLRMEQTGNEYWMKRLNVENSDYSHGHTRGWNLAVDKINKKLDQILQDSDK